MVKFKIVFCATINTLPSQEFNCLLSAFLPPLFHVFFHVIVIRTFICARHYLLISQSVPLLCPLSYGCLCPQAAHTCGTSECGDRGVPRLAASGFTPSPQQDSNLQPTAYKAAALPLSYGGVVGTVGLEPTTFRLEVGCSVH